MESFPQVFTVASPVTFDVIFERYAHRRFFIRLNGGRKRYEYKKSEKERDPQVHRSFLTRIYLWTNLLNYALNRSSFFAAYSVYGKIAFGAL